LFIGEKAMLWDKWKAAAQDKTRWLDTNEKGLLKAEYIENYVLRLWFEEGQYFSIYDLDWKPMILEENPGSVLMPLRNIERFRIVKGDYALIWPELETGEGSDATIDLAPECVRFFCEQYGVRIVAKETIINRRTSAVSQEASLMFPQFPNEKDWNRISQSYPLIEVDILKRGFYQPEGDGSRQSAWEQLGIDPKVHELQIHLSSRLHDIHLSYVMMSFYFEQNISDEDKHETKLSFNYYSHIFYIQLFSAFDNIGHLLNVLYRLEMKEKGVSFKAVVKKIKGKHPALYDCIAPVINSETFSSSSGLRNDITHNFLPGLTGRSVVDRKDMKKEDIEKEDEDMDFTTFGVGEYTTSKKMYQDAIEMLNTLTEVIALTSI
jgi:Cthe_2314-like HEPN